MTWQTSMILRIVLAALPAQLYLAWRLGRAVPVVLGIPHRRVVPLFLVLVAWANALPALLAMRYLTGTLDRATWEATAIGAFDLGLLFPFWIGLVITVELLPYVVALDVLRVIGGRLRFPDSFARLMAGLRLLLAVLLTLYAGVRIGLDTWRVRGNDVPVAVAGLPAELDGLRLAFLADVQVDRFTGPFKLQQAAAHIERFDPDLLLFGGDLVTRGEAYIDDGLSWMCRQVGTSPAIAVVGDHDWWANPGRIRDGLAACGWHVPDNRHQVFDVRGRRVLVTGLTHIYSRRLRRAAAEEFLAAAPEADLKVLLVHQPAAGLVEAAREHGYQLILAGHTHGGQLVWRPFGYAVSGAKFESGPFFQGVHDLGGATLVVTNGVGLTLAPIRYQAPAEVTRVTVTKE